MRWGREEGGVRRMGERGGGEIMQGKGKGERRAPFATPSSHESTFSACSHRCAALARQP